MIEPERAALLLIDMQHGFLDDDSGLCVAGAAATVPACSRALERARQLGMVVFHVRRFYEADGSDVEPTRYAAWAAGGRPLSVASDAPDSLEVPEELSLQKGDHIIVKPRYSAFFNTPLHDELSELGVDTVLLAGTSTPNCIRTTCYDALSLDYNVAVLSDATSSRTPEVQRANLEDMALAGAQLLSTDEFCERGLEGLRDVVGEAARAVEAARSR